MTNTDETQIQKLSEQLEKQEDKFNELLDQHRILEADYRSDKRWAITTVGMLSFFILAFFGWTTWREIPTQARNTVKAGVQEEVANQLPPNDRCGALIALNCGGQFEMRNT